MTFELTFHLKRVLLTTFFHKQKLPGKFNNVLNAKFGDLGSSFSPSNEHSVDSRICTSGMALNGVGLHSWPRTIETSSMALTFEIELKNSVEPETVLVCTYNVAVADVADNALNHDLVFLVRLELNGAMLPALTFEKVCFSRTF